MNELEQRLRAALRVVRIQGQTVQLCPFCERAGIHIGSGRYFCDGCHAYGGLSTLAIYVPIAKESELE